jgi:hypothetical protein
MLKYLYAWEKRGEKRKKGDRIFIGNLRDCDRVLSAPAGSSFSFTIHVHVGRGLYLLGTSLLPIGDEQHTAMYIAAAAALGNK